jgi:hypothetical protein
MKNLSIFLLLCFVSTSSFAGRDDYIIYKSGDGTHVKTRVDNHCVDNGYIRPKSFKKASRVFCDIIGPNGRQSIEECEDEYIVYEVLGRHMYLKEDINLGNDRRFIRYYRDKYVAKRSFPQCEETLNTDPHPSSVTRKATLQEMLFYGALYQQGIKSITNETITPKQASEGNWGSNGDRLRSIMIHYDSPSCRSGEVVGDGAFNEAEFFRMGGEGSGSGMLGGEGSGSGYLSGEGSGSGRLGGEGSGSGRVLTRVNITPERISSLRIYPNIVERQLGLRPQMARYLTGETKIPRSVMGVKCQK